MIKRLTGMEHAQGPKSQCNFVLGWHHTGCKVKNAWLVVVHTFFALLDLYTGKRTGKKGRRQKQSGVVNAGWPQHRWDKRTGDATMACFQQCFAANQNAHKAPMGNAKTPLPFVNIEINSQKGRGEEGGREDIQLLQSTSLQLVSFLLDASSSIAQRSESFPSKCLPEKMLR